MATTSQDPLVNALCELGFTEIEALVYAFLVGSEAATGYRISHAIGKPTANTYKAIASLAQQGAVQVDEGGNRLVRAVPPDELLAGLERRSREKREAARAALRSTATTSSDGAGCVITESITATAGTSRDHAGGAPVHCRTVVVGPKRLPRAQILDGDVSKIVS